MAGKIVPRDVSPFLNAIRNFLLGRNPRNALRHEMNISARTQPDPVLPDGPHDKLSANYYYTRDGRRELKPGEVLFDNNKTKALQSGENALSTRKLVTPGQVFHWD